MQIFSAVSKTLLRWTIALKLSHLLNMMWQFAAPCSLITITICVRWRHVIEEDFCRLTVRTQAVHKQCVFQSQGGLLSFHSGVRVCLSYEQDSRSTSRIAKQLGLFPLHKHLRPQALRLISTHVLLSVIIHMHSLVAKVSAESNHLTCWFNSRSILDLTMTFKDFRNGHPVRVGLVYGVCWAALESQAVYNITIVKLRQTHQSQLRHP